MIGVAISTKSTASSQAARRRGIDDRSVTVPVSTSWTAAEDVIAASSNRKKKAPPKSWPAGICANRFVIVRNKRPGPAFGSRPNANSAGNIISPASSATPVSQATTITVLPGTSLRVGCM